jgi:hypothetical protein
LWDGDVIFEANREGKMRLPEAIAFAIVSIALVGSAAQAKMIAGRAALTEHAPISGR